MSAYERTEAIRMLRDGISVNRVARLLGLDLDAVRRLQGEISGQQREAVSQGRGAQAASGGMSGGGLLSGAGRTDAAVFVLSVGKVITIELTGLRNLKIHKERRYLHGRSY